jgi:hypothetical protein
LTVSRIIALRLNYKMPYDFITTIDSDDEQPIQNGSSSKAASKQQGPAAEKDEFDADFEFDFGAGGKESGLNSWETEQAGEVQRVRSKRSDRRCVRLTPGR